MKLPNNDTPPVVDILSHPIMKKKSNYHAGRSSNSDTALKFIKIMFRRGP